MTVFDVANGGIDAASAQSQLDEILKQLDALDAGSVSSRPASQSAAASGVVTPPTKAADEFDGMLAQLDALDAPAATPTAATTAATAPAKPGMDRASDLLSAANEKLGNVIGLPVDAINGLVDSITGSETPSFRKDVVGFMRKAGMIKEGFDPNSFEGRTGSALMEGILTMGGLAGGGGKALSMAANNVNWTNLGKGIDAVVKSIKSNPGVAVVSELGAAPGAVAGGEQGAKAGPFGEALGEAGGAFLGGGVAGLAAGAGKIVAKPFLAAGRKVGEVAGDMFGQDPTKATFPKGGVVNAEGAGTGKWATDLANSVDERLQMNPHIGDDVWDNLHTLEARAAVLNDNIVESTKNFRANPTPEARAELMAMREEERAIHEASNRINSRIPEEAHDPLQKALRDLEANTGATRSYAESQVHDLQQQIERKTMDAINDIDRPGLTPEQYQVRVREGLEKAEKAASDIESKMWARAPVQRRFTSMDDLRADMADYKAELRNRGALEETIPTKLIERVDALIAQGLPVRGEDGRMTRGAPLPRILDVREHIAAVRQARKNELANQSKAADDRYLGNLTGLENILHKSIGDAFPNEVALSQARAISVKYHDLFSRSNLRQVLASGRQGEDKVRPEQTVDSLMKRFQGLKDVLTMTGDREMWAPLRAPQRQNMARGVEGNFYPGQLGAREGINADIENFVHATFHEVAAASTNDPSAVAKIAKDLAKRARDVAPVVDEMDRVGTAMKNAMAAQKDLDKSALSRYTQMDADKAIQGIWQADDPAGMAKQLTRTFQGDPAALRGWQQGHTEQLLSGARKGEFIDPLTLRRQMQDPTTERLMRTVLPSEQYARLERLVDVAARMASGEIKTVGDAVLKPALMLARITGAGWVGGVASKLMFRGSSLQINSIMSQGMRDIVNKMLKSDPTALFTKAVMDPNAERLLLQKAPTNGKDLAEFNKLTRRVVAGMEGLRESASQYWEMPGGKEAPPERQDFLTPQQGDDQELGFPKSDEKFFKSLGKLPTNMDSFMSGGPSSTNVEDRRYMNSIDNPFVNAAVNNAPEKYRKGRAGGYIMTQDAREMHFAERRNSGKQRGPQ